jgi:hypothetical protein
MDQIPNNFFLLLAVYSIGFALVMESAWRLSSPHGVLLCTLGEIKFNGFLCLSYFLLTGWFFYKSLSFFKWYEIALDIFGALTLGTIAASVLLRFLGIVRGLGFLVSVGALLYSTILVYNMP